MNQQPLLVLHLPQAGANHSWGSSMTNCSWWVHIPDCSDNQSFPAFITLGINCWSVRCHDTCMLTNRYQVVTIPPLFRFPGYIAYRTFGSNLFVSVAWQRLFLALGNSAFPTTCHNIIQQYDTQVCNSQTFHVNQPESNVFKCIGSPRHGQETTNEGPEEVSLIFPALYI
jgi:hypothetical protein